MVGDEQILSDHKKIGKKFIPPFIDKLGPIKETSWIKQIVPELIWIALLNHRYGFQQGADLSLSLAKATKEATGKDEWYAPISSFYPLSNVQKDKILELLDKENKLNSLSTGLFPLNYYYSKSPLNFFNGKKSQESIKKAVYLTEIKNVLTSLYDRHSKEATFTQANAIYICFVLGKLKVTSSSALANFPEIENYPNTEESKKIAAFVRASINGFIGMDLDDRLTDWQAYFWGRGLEIDNCY